MIIQGGIARALARDFTARTITAESARPAKYFCARREPVEG
jgi:hypothetical protein